MTEERRTPPGIVSRRKLLISMGLAPVVASMFGCASTDADTDGAGEDGEVEFLFVQSAVRATLGSGQLLLKGVSPSTIYFSDRPERITGHIHTPAFVQAWDTGGEESFKAVPPNATISIVTGPVPQEIVVELMNPRLNGDELMYEVVVLEGSDNVTGEASSLFIDTIGRPLTPVSVAGHHRRVRRRTRRRVRRR